MLRVHQSRLVRRSFAQPLRIVLVLITLVLSMFSSSQTGIAQAGYDDHKNMMEQLGIKAIRGGPDPNDQSTFDEAKANPYKDSMPDVLRMKDGTE